MARLHPLGTDGGARVMTATTTLCRMRCPKCGWNVPGRYHPAALIDCCGGNTHPGAPRHKATTCVATATLPMEENQ